MNAVIVWRICAATYSELMFNGEGGLYAKGRWHPKGLPIVYASDSRALAALEILANTLGSSSLQDRLWVIASAEIPSALIKIPARYPSDWRSNPSPESTRTFGKDWLSSADAPVLRVPSAVILGEFNYLLNPRHPDFTRITLRPPQPFAFDARF